MLNLADDIKIHFRKFYFGDISVDSFTEWLYANAELENVIGYDHWYALLEFDYRKRDDIDLAKKLVKQLYEAQKPDLLIIEHAKSIAENVLDNSLGLHDGCRKLAQLLYKDYPRAEKYIDLVFTGYEDELERLDNTNFYDDRILADVKKLLANLNSILSKYS